jgi:hypothetical protein
MRTLHFLYGDENGIIIIPHFDYTAASLPVSRVLTVIQACKERWPKVLPPSMSPHLAKLAAGLMEGSGIGVL